MKIVINKCFGGFGLSKRALRAYQEIKQNFEVYDWEIDRTDPILIQVVEQLGNEVNGKSASLKVVEIPDSVRFYINDYDGNESIHEAHRSWS